jgi:hypothetical protein
MKLRIVKHTPSKHDKVYYTVEQKLLFWWVVNETPIPSSLTFGNGVRWSKRHETLPSAQGHRDALISTEKGRQEVNSIKWSKEVVEECKIV